VDGRVVRDFTNYGLEHWGSDDGGVANTRRFLLEWLSFLYRCVGAAVGTCSLPFDVYHVLTL
jgi:tRNA-dihydrouridine synthase 3